MSMAAISPCHPGYGSRMVLIKELLYPPKTFYTTVKKGSIPDAVLPRTHKDYQVCEVTVKHWCFICVKTT